MKKIQELPESKMCSKCQQTKDVGEFLVKRKRRGKFAGETYTTVRSYCLGCQNAACRNASLDKEKLKIRRHKKRDTIRAFLNDYKNSCSCLTCGETCNACLDFHHLEPDGKRDNISALRNKTLALLKAEIAKCIVLCSNCHRKFHAGLISLPTSAVTP